MSIVAWLLFGLIAGLAANKIVNRAEEGYLVNIILGMMGALLGGFALHLIAGPDFSTFNLWSGMASLSGAVIILVLHQVVIRRRPAD